MWQTILAAGLGFAVGFVSGVRGEQLRRQREERRQLARLMGGNVPDEWEHDWLADR